MIDVDGGIGTMQVYAAKGRREMPDDQVYLDGPVEQLGRAGQFMGRHICTPLQGVAVHINAFNFPVWGMLEKLAPTLLAGVPAIVKPATATCQVTEACFRLMIQSGILPDGAIQLVTGGLGDMLDHLDCQDVVSFTGSAETALKLRSTPVLVERSVRFASEQDSLNASVLGSDAGPGTPEFDLFVKEVQREMTAKAGQKCTAIRRIMVPQPHVDALIAALSDRLTKVTIGDPRLEGTKMGALVSQSQRRDVLEKAALIGSEATRVFGDPDAFAVEGADAQKGAFVPPMLFHCADPDAATHVHDTEAFGPVSTIMPYRDTDHAIALLNKGKGVAGRLHHHPRRRDSTRHGDGRRRVSRAALFQQPRLDGRGDGPRCPPAPYGPRGSGACRRRRGTGRRARCHALHAAHRHSGQPRYSDRHRQAMGARRDRDFGPRPPVHPPLWRAGFGRDVQFCQPHRVAGGYRDVRSFHR